MDLDYDQKAIQLDQKLAFLSLEVQPFLWPHMESLPPHRCQINGVQEKSKLSGKEVRKSAYMTYGTITLPDPHHTVWVGCAEQSSLC